MISNRQNQRLKDIRRLRRSKGAQALLEGPHLVAEALAAGLPLDEVLATPPFLATPEGRRLAALLPAAPLEVAPELLDGLTDADSPQGVLAVARLPRAGVAALPVAPGRPYLYLDGLQDPGNLGALARVAEAAGAAGLALSPGCVHPNHPRALRASAGSLLRLPVAVAADPDALSSHLAAAHPRWAALVPRDGQSLYDAPLGGTLILAVGAEGPGLSPTLLARADLRLTIPMEPAVESLNATVAAALVLFEVRRAAVQKGWRLPKRDDPSPQKDEAPSKKDEGSPKKDGASSKKDEASSKLDEGSPKKDGAPSKKDEGSPKKDGGSAI